MRNKIIVFLFLSILGFVCLLGYSSAQPAGGSIVFGNSSGAILENVTGNDSRAYSGNITELLVYGFSNTQSWQGYYGNVSGGMVQLADANNNVLYNWSSVSTQGEIYSSINSTIAWNNVQCFNFTANGTIQTAGESAGGTSLAGLNVSQIESMYNILPTDGDGLDETFKLGDPIAHRTFYTSNLNFSDGECPSTAIFDSTGTSVDGNFEEVLLYDSSTASLIFTSLLEDSVGGFNLGSQDFEMLVLEDGHLGDVDTTTYYFYVEIG